VLTCGILNNGDYVFFRFLHLVMQMCVYNRFFFLFRREMELIWLMKRVNEGLLPTFIQQNKQVVQSAEFV